MNLQKNYILLSFATLLFIGLMILLSILLFAKANIFPGGICHPLRYFHPYPFYIKRAKGSKIWDVDNNQYTDYWMGHYSLIFGHSYPPIIKHLSSEMENGTQWGIVNNLQIKLAEKIINNIKSAEMGKFANTGMEANTYAIRLARAYTKNKIVLSIFAITKNLRTLFLRFAI